jgi:hypothetical protein
MATTAEITAAKNTGRIAGLTTVALRKMASEYGIKGMSSARKADLLAAIEIKEIELAQIEELAAVIAGKAKAAKKSVAKRDLDQSDVDADGEMAADAKPAKKSTKCNVCGTRKIDKKTQGRDSTMCAPCYDYAGWENSHNDNGHDAIQGSETPEHIEEMRGCLVCLGLDPAKEDAKPAKATKKTVAKPAKIVDGENPKAARFAADAVAAGWKVGSIKKVGNVTTVIVLAGGGEYVQIAWDGTQCVNTGTTHKGTDGKVRKVRNASAARKILEG